MSWACRATRSRRPSGSTSSAASCWAPRGLGAAAALARDVRREPDRVNLPRCAIGPDGRLAPAPHQGSHAITSLAGADAIGWDPGREGALPAGEPVAYAPLAP